MAGVFKNFLESLRWIDDEEDYDDYLEEEEEKELRKIERKEKAATKQQIQPTVFKEDSVVKKEKVSRMEKTTNNKVVPIRTTPKGFEVCIMKPSDFEDSQDICDMLIAGRAAVINLEGFDVDVAQRIMDFISGAVYSMNGRLHQISNYIFIISPDNIDISGDYLDLLQNNGFEVPTLNKEF